MERDRGRCPGRSLFSWREAPDFVILTSPSQDPEKLCEEHTSVKRSDFKEEEIAELLNLGHITAKNAMRNSPRSAGTR